MYVTCWYAVSDEGLKYSHYSEGFHPDNLEPPYKCDSQRVSWAKKIWQPRRAELIGGKIVNEDAG